MLGFTLVEVMLTLAVSTIVMLGGLSILAMAVRYFNVSIRSLEADAELYIALAAVKEHLVQAVDLRHNPSGNCFTSLSHTSSAVLSGDSSNPNHHGRISPCVSGDHNPNQRIYLAVFHAEMGTDDNLLRGVSIGFITPTTDTSGGLVITRAPATGYGNTVNLQPNSNNSIVFAGLVAADVDEVRARSEGASDQGRVDLGLAGMAVSAKVTLTRRIFLSTQQDYCYPISRCSGTEARFVDRSRSASVSFRNNLQLERAIPSVDPAVPAPHPAAMRKRTFGNAYFFRPITPRF